MIDTATISANLQAAFPGDQVALQEEGSHLAVTLVSETFAGKRSVQRQQMVYKVLNEYIASGEVHAVHLRLFTPDEFASA